MSTSTDEPFRTDYEFLKGVDYIFVSFERNLSGEECHELAEKFFETHKGMTLPGQALRVDLRPAFRKPLAACALRIANIIADRILLPEQPRWYRSHPSRSRCNFPVAALR